MIDRRTFLQIPLVFALRELFGPAPDTPAWWGDALDRMKRLDRPGLVFVGPEGDKELDQVGFALRDLLESGDSCSREIFCGAVVICLHPELARALVGAPGQVLALTPGGRVAGTWSLALDELKDSISFEERFAKRLFGEDGARLAEAAERRRTALTEAEKTALADIDHDEIQRREAATAQLALSSELLMPLLIHERRRAGNTERAGRIRSVINARFDAADEISPGPRLPFGSKYERFPYG